MENKVNKLRHWILGSFQFLTLGLLAFCILLLINQKSDIEDLKSHLRRIDNNGATDQIESSLNNVESKLNDIESMLDEVETNLSSEIDDVRRAVILWSN